jgi:hypothetical protein
VQFGQKLDNQDILCKTPPQRGVPLEHREANRPTDAPIGVVASGRNSDRDTA